MAHIIKIDGIIGWDFEVKDLRDQLSEANGKDVVVEIASPGGMISEGLMIYNELKNYRGNVDTHLVGMVASMASYIAMVGKHRVAENNAVFMIHNGSGLAIGDHRVMFHLGKHLDSLTNIIAKELAFKSDTDLAEIRTAMDETTRYYGDEIQEAGFVHEMVGDEEPEDRDEALAAADLMFNECLKKINTPELVKKDMDALATMMADNEAQKIMAGSFALKATLDKIENKPEDEKEVTAMTMEELKEKYPDLYDKIVAIGTEAGKADGIAQERARVKKLIETRAKFPKAHSQKIVDEAIAEDTEPGQLIINLLAADQVAAELEAAKKDPKPPGNGEGEAPEMKDDVMTCQEHIDSVSARIAALPGVM